jgi:hypothetical protein
MNRLLVWILRFSAFSIALTSSTSFAVTFSMPTAGGAVYIGNIGSHAYAVVFPSGGNCYRSLISHYGLPSDLIVEGSPASDIIVVLTGNVTFCTWAMTPLDTNGHDVELRGDDEDDNVYGGYLAWKVYGQNGNDWVGSDYYSPYAYGGNDDDVVYSASTNADLYGQSGDDELCAINDDHEVWIMDGGTGSNYHCGYGSYLHWSFVGSACPWYCAVP